MQGNTSACSAGWHTFRHIYPGFRGGFSLSVGIQELTVTYFSKVPILLSLSSSSLSAHTVSLRSCWMCFYSFSIPPLSIHVHYILFFSVIFVCLTAYQRPLFLIFCPAVSLSLISKCAVVYCAECRLCPWHQDLVPVSHPRCLFMLSVPTCHVCLSASVLMDLSVVGLQHILQSWMSLTMICISLEPWDESVRLVKRCKGAFHHVNHLWFCVSSCLTAETRHVNRQAWPNTL